MGGDRRPLPKCQLEEEKLPDPSWGSPPNIMSGKAVQRLSLLNIWQDQSAFQNAIQKQPVSLPTLGADSCSTEFSLS